MKWNSLNIKKYDRRKIFINNYFFLLKKKKKNVEKFH